MGMIGAVKGRIHDAAEWVRGIRAVFQAMAELDRAPPMPRERPADLRELKASPPPRPRPVPAPPRVAGRKVVAAAPVAAKVARARKPPQAPRGPLPGTKVKRGQKHR